MSMLSSGINIGVENLKSTFENVSLYLGIIVYTAAGAKVQCLPKSSDRRLLWNLVPPIIRFCYMRSTLQGESHNAFLAHPPNDINVGDWIQW